MGKERTSLEQDSKFARALGSSDFHTREAGLRALTTWLSRKHDIEELELLKLWKGVFYCFWHSDKAAVQTALAERLSEIMNELPEAVGWLYYATFVRTMRREWAGIDRLRLDKFMLLIRKFVGALLRHLQAHQWQPQRVQRVADFWRAEILLPQDTLAAAGVAYHLADLLLPELAACVRDGGAGAPPDDATLRRLLEPFAAALAAAGTPALIYRLKQGVFDPLVAEVRQPGEGAPLQGLDVAAFAARLFDLGAKAETRARNREALYAASEALERAAGKRQQQQPAQQRRQQQQQQGPQRRQGQQPEQEQRAPASGKKEARSKGAQAEAAEPQQHAAAGRQEQGQEAEPASAKKSSKKRRQQGGEEAAAAAASPLQERPQLGEAATPAAAAPPTSGKKKARRSRLGPGDGAAQGEAPQQQAISLQEQQLLAAAVAAVTGGGAAGTPGGSPAKKSVRFSLKRNLVNVLGQPPKPADVRTPPSAKPKGPALKRASAVGGPSSAPERLLTRAGAERQQQFQAYMNGRGFGTDGGGAAAAAPGSSKKEKKKKRRASAPLGTARPRASEFF